MSPSGPSRHLTPARAMSRLPLIADIASCIAQFGWGPKNGHRPERLGVHQIDRTKKIHLADVDAIVAEDGISHRDVEESVGDCHLQQVVLAADDLAGRP